MVSNCEHTEGFHTCPSCGGNICNACDQHMPISNSIDIETTEELEKRIRKHIEHNQTDLIRIMLFGPQTRNDMILARACVAVVLSNYNKSKAKDNVQHTVKH